MKTILFTSMFIAHVFYYAGSPVINFVFFCWVAPSFAALVGINSFSRSSNPLAFALRLFVWACITQPVYLWFFDLWAHWYIPNILFGLAGAAFFTHMARNIHEPLKIPSWCYYAAYPLHFVLIKALFTLGNSAQY
jgi:hypothetical protein